MDSPRAEAGLAILIPCSQRQQPVTDRLPRAARGLEVAILTLALGYSAPSLSAATFTVTTTADSGAASLRQAILDANATVGDDTIAFSVTGTITLASALPAITDGVTICGPGTNLLTISGNDLVPIFSVNAISNPCTIAGLTIANGRATGYANGAGVNNAGELNLVDCAVVNNQNLGGWGGAIFNSGTLSLRNSTLSGNQVIGQQGGRRNGNVMCAGGGGAGMGGAIFTMSGFVGLRGCALNDNTASGGKGGWDTGAVIADGRGGGIYGGRGYQSNNGEPGGFAGGGGGGGGTEYGGRGGYGGGGGGSGGGRAGGQGGFGGGAGGTGSSSVASTGGGGAGVGGAIFVHSGTLVIVDSWFSGNQAIGGSGGGGASSGSGIGADVHSMDGIVLPNLTATTLGGGTVVIDPPSAPYLNDSLVTATATPSPGWRLLNWLGDARGTNQMISVLLNRSKYVQAVFGTELTFSPLITSSPQSDYYPFGTPIRMTALLPIGTYFASWSGNATGTDNPMTYIVSEANQSISCLFAPLNIGEFALTLIESGQGHVSRRPSVNVYTNGQLVTLTATPLFGQEFIAWSGHASGSENPLVVTMSNSKTITATFSRRPVLQVGTHLEGLVEDGFRMTLSGEFGEQYSILGSTNLIDWAESGTVTNTHGVVQFTDGSATNLSTRLYRAVQVQP